MNIRDYFHSQIEEKGYTYKDMATLMNVGPTYVSNIMTGARKIGEIMFKRLCAALELDEDAVRNEYGDQIAPRGGPKPKSLLNHAPQKETTKPIKVVKEHKAIKDDPAEVVIDFLHTFVCKLNNDGKRVTMEMMRMLECIPTFSNIKNEEDIMEKQIIRFKLDEGAFAPERAHSIDSGIDLRSPIDTIIRAKGSVVIDTGVHPEIRSYEDGIGSSGLLLPRSGLNIKHDVIGFGVIDEGYSGSIAVKLYNLGDEEYHVHRGDKIIQMIVADVRYVIPEIVNDINSGERGDSGFGSTGR